MKKTVIVTSLIIGISLGATLLASVLSPKVKPSKQELPEVLVEGVPTKVKGYSTNFTVEIGKFCPREYPDQPVYEKETVAEGVTIFVKHCEKCNTGVYSELKDETEFINGKPVKRCTFCNATEPKS